MLFKCTTGKMRSRLAMRKRQFHYTSSGQRTSAGRDKVVWSTVVRQYQMLRPRSIVGADVLRFHKAALRLQGS